MAAGGITDVGFSGSGLDALAWITTPDPPTPGPSGRFFEGYPWRFLFADTPSIFSPGGVTTTWADGLLTARQIAFTLNQPSVIEAAVWPDDRRVNAIFGPDSDPLVAQSNRIIYAFRREGLRTVDDEVRGPWWIRAAGILMSPQDQGDTDIPLSHITAYDPWKFLEAKPVRNAAGNLPGPNGLTWFNTRGGIIVGELLSNTILNDGGFAFIDAGVAYGGTSYWQGTIEDTLHINFQAQQGTMVGDAWSQLCDAGKLDIVLTAIYDPDNRPGYTHELSVFNLAGDERPSAVFSWDMLSRSANRIDRMHDGTPGSFINRVQYYVGQGGFPLVPSEENTDSINKYLTYWDQGFQTSQTVPTESAVRSMAQLALKLAKQGRRTMTIAATPERSPVPLLAYGLGDRVPIYATDRLRVAAAGYQRVQGIPITITDDGIEQVEGLLCSPDWDDTRE